MISSNGHNISLNDDNDGVDNDKGTRQKKGIIWEFFPSVGPPHHSAISFIKVHTILHYI